MTGPSSHAKDSAVRQVVGEAAVAFAQAEALLEERQFEAAIGVLSGARQRLEFLLRRLSETAR
jgi:hypothetical protein